MLFNCPSEVSHKTFSTTPSFLRKELLKTYDIKGQSFLSSRRLFLSKIHFSNLPEARQTLGPKKIRDLINKAHDVAVVFRQKETELIQVLKELDDTKAYRATGYNSLFRFCVESLQLTEHQSYNYITVARKCTEIPELMVALEDRRITVSKARRMASVINSDNQSAWIELAEKSSQRDLESAVRAKDPLPSVRDHLQILSQSDVKLQATLDKSVEQKLRRVIELLSEKSHGSIKINDALDEMCDLFLEKNDPLIVAERRRASAKSEGKHKAPNSARAHLGEYLPTSDMKFPKNLKGRIAIPAETKHQIWARDQGQCRFHRQGKRCESRRYLEIHHKVPVFQGGNNSLENLVLICSEHHKAIHQRF